MKRNIFVASILVFIVGLVSWIYGANYSYVDSAGILHDTAWLPIGVILTIVGVVALILSTTTLIIEAKNYHFLHLES